MDSNKTELSESKLAELEELRVTRLNEAGINEEEVLHKALEDQKSWQSFFGENITRGKDDQNFAVRDQWTALERSEFNRLFKPCMTFNKVYVDIKKTVGEQRKNKPDLMVRSLTGKASQEQIDLRADLIRTIAYDSQNDLVYQTAFKSALLMGFGAFQISLDYQSPRSFHRVIRYELIPDSTVCAFDPSALKPHKGDGNSCSRRYSMSRAQFDATHPYIVNPVSYSDPFAMADYQWEMKDNIVLCRRYVKEWFPVIIYQLSNGDVVTAEEWEKMQKIFAKRRDLAEGSIIKNILEKDLPKIVSERQTQDYKIREYLLLQNQIVDFSEFPGKELPIIFVDGDSSYIEGKQYTKSFIREARDAQKSLNYLNSEIIAEIKNRRREQWLATPENIAGQEQQWRNPELQQGALIAKPHPGSGAMPLKLPPWDVSPQLMQNAMKYSQEMREIMGTTETDNLQGRDISGKARKERKLESSMASYVYFDNLNQAIEQGGRVCLGLLPYIIGDDERHFVLSKKDGRSQSIILNQRVGEGENEKVINKLEPGDFDIEIDTGPSFAVQKEISLEFLQQTLAASPQVFPLIADLWAKNLDVQFMPQIAERFKTLVPPEILAKESGEPPPPPKPNPEQEMIEMQRQAFQQELELKAAEIKERAAELEIRRNKHELEKVEMMLKAQEAQRKFAAESNRNNIELQKAEMSYSKDITKTLIDVHKHLNPIAKGNKE